MIMINEFLTIPSFNKLCYKLKLSDIHVEYLAELLSGLIELDYIKLKDISKYINILDSNITHFTVSGDNSIDFKPGHYDARKKEIYLKANFDKETFFHRFTYALITKTEESGRIYMGYDCIFFDLDKEAFEHHNFGINRAVVTDVVLSILDLHSDSSATTSIDRDAITKVISSKHKLYFLEDNLFNQLCIALNIPPSEFSKNLFKNSTSFLNMLKTKHGLTDSLLAKLDTVSRHFSHYNKINYYKDLKNDIEHRKEIIFTDIVNSELEREAKTVNYKLKDMLENNGYMYSDIETLSDNYKTIVLKNVESYQYEMVDILMNNITLLEPFAQAVKLKRFNEFLLNPSEKLNDAIHETIHHKLLSETELTSTNYIETIKYNILYKLIDSDKFYRVYHDLYFQISLNLQDGETTYILLLNKATLIDVLKTDKDHYAVQIPFDSIHNLVSNDKLEKSKIQYQELFNELKIYLKNPSLKMSDVSVTIINNTEYIVLSSFNQIYMFAYAINGNNYIFNLLTLSEQYYITKVGKNVSNNVSLVLSETPKNVFKKIFSFLFRKAS